MYSHMKAIRRLLVSTPEEGWDKDIEAGDRPLLSELRSLITEMARFRQARSATVHAAETGDEEETNSGATFMDGIFGDSETAAEEQQVEYTLTANADLQCYFFNVLFPRNVDITADRFGLICSLSPAHILPCYINVGVDLQHGRPYMVVRVNKKSNPMSFSSRLVIIEQLGAGPAMRCTPSLPLGEGVSVKRTQDGTIINSYGSQRSSSNKRPRSDSDYVFGGH